MHADRAFNREAYLERRYGTDPEANSGKGWTKREYVKDGEEENPIHADVDWPPKGVEPKERS